MFRAPWNTLRGQLNVSDHNTHSGMAALSICEALMLALNDAQILPEAEILGVLKDAADGHGNIEETDVDFEDHQAVAILIRKIIDGGNSVRRGLVS